MSQGYVTTRGVTVNLNGTSDTGTAITGGNIGGSPVFLTYIPSVVGLIPAGTLPLSKLAQGAATTSQFVQFNGTAWVPHSLVAADVLGLAASATTDTTNAANISSGTLPSARLVGAYGSITGLGTLTSLALSGALTAASGTVAAVGVAVGGAGTGLYSPGANQLGIAANGTVWATLNSGGGGFTSITGETDFPAGTENAPLVFVNAVGLYGSGTLLGFAYAHHKLFTIQPGLIAAWDNSVNNYGGILQSGLQYMNAINDTNVHATFGPYTSSDNGNKGVVQFMAGTASPAAATPSNGAITFAQAVLATSSTVTVQSYQSNYTYTSSGALTATLPTAANSYVGQMVTFIQENAAVLTVSAPSGVSVTMNTGSGTTTRTASTFASSGTSGTNGTSATLLCTATNGSSTATWRQIGGIGTWT